MESDAQTKLDLWLSSNNQEPLPKPLPVEGDLSPKKGKQAGIGLQALDEKAIFKNDGVKSKWRVHKNINQEMEEKPPLNLQATKQEGVSQRTDKETDKTIEKVFSAIPCLEELLNSERIFDLSNKRTIIKKKPPDLIINGNNRAQMKCFSHDSYLNREQLLEISSMLQTSQGKKQDLYEKGKSEPKTDIGKEEQDDTKKNLPINLANKVLNVEVIDLNTPVKLKKIGEKYTKRVVEDIELIERETSLCIINKKKLQYSEFTDKKNAEKLLKNLLHPEANIDFKITRTPPKVFEDFSGNLTEMTKTALPNVKRINPIKLKVRDQSTVKKFPEKTLFRNLLEIKIGLNKNKMFLSKKKFKDAKVLPKKQLKNLEMQPKKKKARKNWKKMGKGKVTKKIKKSKNKPIKKGKVGRRMLFRKKEKPQTSIKQRQPDYHEIMKYISNMKELKWEQIDPYYEDKLNGKYVCNGSKIITQNVFWFLVCSRFFKVEFWQENLIKSLTKDLGEVSNLAIEESGQKRERKSLETLMLMDILLLQKSHILGNTDFKRLSKLFNFLKNKKRKKKLWQFKGDSSHAIKNISYKEESGMDYLKSWENGVFKEMQNFKYKELKKEMQEKSAIKVQRGVLKIRTKLFKFLESQDNDLSEEQIIPSLRKTSLDNILGVYRHLRKKTSEKIFQSMNNIRKKIQETFFKSRNLLIDVNKKTSGKFDNEDLLKDMVKVSRQEKQYLLYMEKQQKKKKRQELNHYQEVSNVV